MFIENFKQKIHLNATINEAMKIMDRLSCKLLIVLNDNSKYISLLSIGDIQRAILNGMHLENSINKVLRNDYIIAKPSDKIEDLKRIMISIRAEFMPIVDDDSEILDVLFWKDIFDKNIEIPVGQFNLPIVIMAGGYGSRLKPLTNVLPKPLIPIGEKTMLEEIFERFFRHGNTCFFISTNYKADLIKYYLDSLKLPFSVSCFNESKPLGTAGSLTMLKSKIFQTFFVSNCDILIDDDYSKFLEYHKMNNNEITIISAIKQVPIAYGTLSSGPNGELISIEEKPNFSFNINTGMYILEPHLLNEIPENIFFHITNLIEKILKRKGKIGVFPVSEKSWIDMGTWQDYQNFINL